MVRPCPLRPPTLVTRAVPPRCKARIHWVSYNDLTATSLEWWWVEVAIPQCRYFRWHIMIRPDIIIQPETWSMLYEYVWIINILKPIYTLDLEWVLGGCSDASSSTFWALWSQQEQSWSGACNTIVVATWPQSFARYCNDSCRCERACSYIFDTCLTESTAGGHL